MCGARGLLGGQQGWGEAGQDRAKIEDLRVWVGALIWSGVDEGREAGRRRAGKEGGY